MPAKKNKIQFLLNEYLECHGSINILLPDGVNIEMGITQEGKNGAERKRNYCWVTTSREGCSTILDKYAMSMHFEDIDSKFVINQADEGIVTVV